MGLWNKGANQAVDIMLTRPGLGGVTEALFILRKRDQLWALPGGFLDKDEIAIEAAARELKEETGLDLPVVRKVFSGKVEDPRNEEDRWIETTLFHFHGTHEDFEEAKAGDDAEGSKWMPIIPEVISKLYADHPLLVKMVYGPVKPSL